MCNDEPLYKDHTLKFVYVTRWRTKEPPMRLHYIPKVSYKFYAQGRLMEIKMVLINLGLLISQHFDKNICSKLSL